MLFRSVVAVEPNGREPVVHVNFPGFGIHCIDSAWLHQEIRHGVTGALAPAYAITTHVAQGQTMDAGRAVITDTTATEAAYVALTRGRNDARLYVLDSPARTARRAAADDAEFPVLLDEPELLKAVADRLQRKAASETATSVNQSALAVHRMSLLPINEIMRGGRHRAEALGVALDRVQFQALLDPPAAYTHDYGQRPDNDHPNRAAWDRIVSTRARHEAMHGPWTATPLDPALSNLHVSAKTAVLDALNLDELLARIEAPSTSVTEWTSLEDAFQRRVEHAVTEPANYLTTLLGPRPADPNDEYGWDDDARDIERVRHRNGIRPADGITSLDPTGVLGDEPDDLHDSRNWEIAARLVEAQLEPDRDLTHEEPRRRGPSIRM